jgi:hypothetical protein
VIFTERLWFLHAEYNSDMHECGFHAHECDWFLHTECDFYMQSAKSTRKHWFSHAQVWFWHTRLGFRHFTSAVDTKRVIFIRMNVIWKRTCVIKTRTSVISKHRAWFVQLCTTMLFQHAAYTFKTIELKCTSDYQTNLDWVLTSGFTTSTSVFLKRYVWFWHERVWLTYAWMRFRHAQVW